MLTVGSVFEGVEMGLKVDAMPWQAATPSLVGFCLKRKINTRSCVPVALRRI
ncbi:hypothetical protein PL9214670246 [Planktothrix tepida PCC 9214]|uniref:Uncharacterized protein n=1 Tax=Planktothrix tepida PCC 9214 TaxID=671072 RepID=A0A1J1LUT9_9CYAN|nr:hypothetical protein PL9214670246 [Planktothrix tepida PCC 9214]